MFRDAAAPGGSGWEPSGPHCHSCRKAIAPGERTAQVRFDEDDERLRTLNGLYHHSCARPILSVKRALDMLRGPHAR